MRTIKGFAEKSNIDASLVRAVIRQIGGWQKFKDRAPDVTNCGANRGFSGFVYYRDTVPFFKRNKTAIMSLAKDMASDLGQDVYEMIAGFNCLKTDSGTVAEAIHNPRTDDPEQVRNALAWFALEEVARAYCDALEYAK